MFLILTLEHSQVAIQPLFLRLLHDSILDVKALS